MRKAATLLTAIGMLGASVAAVAVSSAGGAAGVAPPRLQPFASCAALVEYAKAHAGPLVGTGAVGAEPGTLASPAGAAPGPGGGSDYSTTNVQEAGVDEPDIVKTNGTHVFAVEGNTLFAVNARAAGPRLAGKLALPAGWGYELLLHGTRLLAVSSSGLVVQPAAGGPGILPPFATRTVVSEIDVRNPAAMRLVRTLAVDGSFLAGRLEGRTARLVIASTPRFPPPVQGPPTPAPVEPSRGAIAASGLRNWLPTATLTDLRTGATSTRALVQCRAVRRPPVFSGLGMVTVLTIDLARGLPPVDSDAVMMGAGSVYASPDRLYLSSQRWLPQPVAARPVPVGTTTEIHAFDTTSPDRTTYRASGVVPGFLLNQWSLSEYRGVLRAVSTQLPTWWPAAPQQESETVVSTLAERAGSLATLGRVGGLGNGKRVYAVRFAGPAGYVVTFRQVDPLYTLDLSDPARPQLLGKLELRGYSAYLHPLGGNLLLGVGQAASAAGRLLGTRLALFDVSRLISPRLVDAVSLGAGSSDVEYDPHAFLYWPPRALAVLPVSITSGARQFVGAVAYRLAGRRLVALPRIVHEPAGAGGAVPVQRSLVVGSRLYTVSSAGVEASSLATLRSVAWVPFR